MFKNIIVYGYENDKLWFGRVTLWSWIMAFFVDGRFLEVKPIKGYEQYAYYSDTLMTSLNWCNITNDHTTLIGDPSEKSPLKSITWAERDKGGIKTTVPIH